MLMSSQKCISYLFVNCPVSKEVCAEFLGCPVVAGIKIIDKATSSTILKLAQTALLSVYKSCFWKYVIMCSNMTANVQERWDICVYFIDSISSQYLPSTVLQLKPWTILLLDF